MTWPKVSGVVAELNRRGLLRCSGAGALAGLGLLASCSDGEDNPPAVLGSRAGGYVAGTALTDGPPLPDITLTDQDGKPFRLAHDVKTPVTLVFFGYTHCPDICPGILADLASARSRAGGEVPAKTTVVLISTDPPRDTPKVMREYLKRIDESFIGLTGDLETIKKAGAQLGITMEQTTTLPSGGYEITHGTQVYGFGADRKAQVLWSQGTSVADYKADFTTLVGKEPK